ncbi:hypothetical protein BDZ97DRAFT_750897 [Flammula alnicola]|nr:hypothetical protein BDZ97DRAFT_750897 [Flammula alnicola]
MSSLVRLLLGTQTTKSLENLPRNPCVRSSSAGNTQTQPPLHSRANHAIYLETFSSPLRLIRANLYLQPLSANPLPLENIKVDHSHLGFDYPSRAKSFTVPTRFLFLFVLGIAILFILRLSFGSQSADAVPTFVTSLVSPSLSTLLYISTTRSTGNRTSSPHRYPPPIPLPS